MAYTYNLIMTGVQFFTSRHFYLLVESNCCFRIIDHKNSVQRYIRRFGYSKYESE